MLTWFVFVLKTASSSSLCLVFSVVVPALWDSAVRAATRQLLVRTLNPFGPIWMRSEDFSLSECPPNPLQHTHTHTTTLLQHAHSPHKAF